MHISIIFRCESSSLHCSLISWGRQSQSHCRHHLWNRTEEQRSKFIEHDQLNKPDPRDSFLLEKHLRRSVDDDEVEKIQDSCQYPLKTKDHDLVCSELKTCDELEDDEHDGCQVEP